MNSLIMENLNDSADLDYKMLDNAWRGAEAFHFLILAQRQLYEGIYFFR